MFIEAVILSSAIYAGEKAYRKVKEKMAGDWMVFGKARGRQMDEMCSDADNSEFLEADRKLNRELAVSSGLAVMNAGGYLMGIPVLNLLTVPGLLWLVSPFVRSGFRELTEEHKIGLGVLDATISLAFLMMRYFLLISFFSALMGLTRKMLLRIQDNHKKDLINVFRDIPKHAWIVRDGVEIMIPFDDLVPGDIVVVVAGEVIPADGTVVSGEGSADQHMLTGESQPAEKHAGEQVFASTVLTSGRLRVRIEKAGGETAAAQIGEILSRTSDYKASLQIRGEVIAEKGALPLLVLGALTLPVMGPAGATAVLLSPFCYNMRVISPISILNFLRISSDKGMLVKDGRAMETLKDVDTVVFDKTGTLTLEQPRLARVHACAPYSEGEILLYAAAAEFRQTHPFAMTIRQEAERRGMDVPMPDETECEIGYGLSVRVRGRGVRIGSERFMMTRGIAIPPEIGDIRRECREYGHPLVYVAIDDHLGGVMEMHADIRPEARHVVSELRRRGLEVHIVSGDKESITRHLAKETGVSRYFAEVLPEDKAKIVGRLRESGKKVCFVGDGINDTIALKRSDVSVSLRGAATMATDTAQIILMDRTLRRVPELFDLAKGLDSNMRGNLLATVIPGILCIGGVYILHIGVVAGEFLFYTGLLAGVANAMSPLMGHRKSGKADKADRLPLDPEENPGEPIPDGELRTREGAKVIPISDLMKHRSAESGKGSGDKRQACRLAKIDLTNSEAGREKRRPPKTDPEPKNNRQRTDRK